MHRGAIQNKTAVKGGGRPPIAPALTPHLDSQFVKKINNETLRMKLKYIKSWKHNETRSTIKHWNIS